MPQETFTFSGAQDEWTVPSWVDTVQIEVWGAEGGETYNHNAGWGGYAKGIASVTPGETLYVRVGGQGGDGANAYGATGGAGGWNGGGDGGDSGSTVDTETGSGGGGGGASDVRQGGTTLDDRIIVGAGGGGTAGNEVADGSDGGDGGAATGEDGGGGLGGDGGTQTGGGGSFGAGADGANSDTSSGGGGGGGGWYGGGGGSGGGTSADGGGGGSNYVSALTNTTSTRGVQSGDGKIVITYEPKPPQLTVTGERDTEIDLSIEDIADETAIDLYRAESPGSAKGDYTNIATLAADTTSYTDTSRENGETYYYRSTATNAVGESGLSAEESGTTTIPTPSVAIDATVENELTLTWSKADDNPEGEFELFRSTDGSLGSKIADGLALSTTSYTDTTVVDGETYHYTLRRIAPDATADSTQASATTPHPKPTNVAIDDTTLDTRLIISWTDNADNEDGQRVYLSEDGGTTFEQVAELAPDVETYTTDDLVPRSDSQTEFHAYVESYTEDAVAQSDTATGSLDLGWADTDGFLVGLRDRFGNARTLGTGHNVVNNVNFTLEHTAIESWGATVKKDPDILNWALAETFIYVDGEFLFRGILMQDASPQKSGVMDIQGKGITQLLAWDAPGADGTETVTYTSIPVHEAIRDYWGKTPFEATVHDPDVTVILSDEVVQAADTTSEWDALVSVASDVPIEARNGQLEQLQTSFFSEGEERDRDDGNYSFVNGSHYSSGQAAEIAQTGAFLEWDITPEHTIPADRVGVAALHEADDTPEVEWTLDGNHLDTIPGSATSLVFGWTDAADGDYDLGDGYTGGDLQAGTTYTLRVEVLDGSNGAGYWVDGITLYDKAFHDSSTFDTDVNAEGYLSSPQDYGTVTVNLVAFTDTDFNVSGASVISSWNDTSGVQAIQVSNDGGTTWLPDDGTEQNTSSIDVSFDVAETYGTQVQTRFTLDAYGSRTDHTPTEGYQGQAVDSFELQIDATDLAVIDNQDFDGSHYDNLKKLHEAMGGHWTTKHTPDSLAVESYTRGGIVKEKGVDVDWRAIDRKLTFDYSAYANRVARKGKTQDDGTRPTASVTDQSEIDATGWEILDLDIRQDLDSAGDIRSDARSTLPNRTAEGGLKGWIDIVSAVVEPGYSYTIPYWGETMTLEKVQFAESAGEAQGRLDFVGSFDMMQAVNHLARETARTKDGL